MGQGVEKRMRFVGYGVVRPWCVQRYSLVLVVESVIVRDCRWIGNMGV
jgi:hypothetical protein